MCTRDEKRHTTVKIRDGKTTKIQEGCVVWRGSLNSKIQLAHCTLLLVEKNTMTAEFFVRAEDRGSWNLCFIRRFHDWELENFMCALI